MVPELWFVRCCTSHQATNVYHNSKFKNHCYAVSLTLKEKCACASNADVARKHLGTPHLINKDDPCHSVSNNACDNDFIDSCSSGVAFSTVFLTRLHAFT
jgi:hypothetical protein